MLRSTSALLVLALASCGGGAATAKSASGAEDAAGPGEARADSPGAQCIADANAARDRRADEPGRIGLSHILVRHAELQRPLGATRSREQACLQAIEALDALQGGSEWNDAVERLSDAADSTHGGLGTVSRDDLPAALADAAFALEVDELSYVVESDRGFHILLRTE